jgi:hypothetical protein
MDLMIQLKAARMKGSVATLRTRQRLGGPIAALLFDDAASGAAQAMRDERELQQVPIHGNPSLGGRFFGHAAGWIP